MSDPYLPEHARQMNDAVSAMIELEAMKAENKVRESRNESPAYYEDNFMNLLEQYQLGYKNNHEKFHRFNY
jgi:hypothetical protein